MASKIDRRRPTLADRFVSESIPRHRRFLHPRAVEQVQRGVRNARKFVFDEEAVRRVAQVIIDIPELLIREHQFARAPYDLTWIEFPAWVMFKAMRDLDPVRYDAEGSWGALSSGDHTVGYLIDHTRINVVAGGTVDNPNSRCEMTPLQYLLHTEWPVEDQLEFCRRAGLSRIGIDNFLWGDVYDKLSQDDQRILRSLNTTEFVPPNPLHHELMMANHNMATTVRGAYGELRTLIALLLMINRPSLTRYVETLPSSRGWFKGKQMPFMSHTTITVPIDPVPTLRLIGTPLGDAVERRRHEVKGHYCHNKTARDYMRIAGCIHEWQPTREDWTPWPQAPADDVEHWVCSICEGKRWWRDDHERGSAGVGYVTHEYNVKG